MTDLLRLGTEDAMAKRAPARVSLQPGAKVALKQLIADAFWKLVEETQDELLHTFSNNAQIGPFLVVHDVVEQVLLDLLRQKVIGETFDGLIAKSSA